LGYLGILIITKLSYINLHFFDIYMICNSIINFNFNLVIIL